MKLCSQCGLTKPLEDFYKSSGRADGLHSYCKTCCRAYDAQKRAERGTAPKEPAAPKDKRCQDCGCAYSHHWNGLTRYHGGICGSVECAAWLAFEDSQCPDATKFYLLKSRKKANA